MAIKVEFNARQLEVNIQNIADRASQAARDSLRKTAIRVRDLAREYAPVDTGLLEKNIEYMVMKDERRRNKFVIYIDFDASRYNGRGVLGDYAEIMENQLRPYGQKGKALHLGEKSRAKADTGKKVGGRFLARAVKEGSAEVLHDAVSAVSRVLRDSRSVNMDFQRNTEIDE